MDQQDARAVEAMMAVSRTMTAIVARTLSEVAEAITVPQLAPPSPGYKSRCP